MVRDSIFYQCSKITLQKIVFVLPISFIDVYLTYNITLLSGVQNNYSIFMYIQNDHHKSSYIHQHT